MSTMELIGVGIRAAWQARAQHRAERRARGRAGGLLAAVAEHGLAVAGLSCLTLAAAMIAVPLGLAAAGVACFILEWRVGE